MTARSQRASLNLVFFDGFEQGLDVPSPFEKTNSHSPGLAAVLVTSGVVLLFVSLYRGA